MKNSKAVNSLEITENGIPTYKRNLLYAVALALSLAVLAVSAALAWDQMNLVIDNVQRRNYVEQLDALKNNQRKLIYSLAQTAKLHSRLLVEQHQSGLCDTDIVFPGELEPKRKIKIGPTNNEPFILTTLDDTGCASRLRLLRKLSRSLALSIHDLWDYPEISNYTFNLNGRFLAQSDPSIGSINSSKTEILKKIAVATAHLQPGMRQFFNGAQTPTSPFFTGIHQRAAGEDEVLSIGVPIYRRNKLFAVTAIDIEHRAFNKIFIPGGRLPGFFVFDISHPSPVLLNDITAEELPLVQLIFEHWHSINAISQKLSVTKIGHRFYLAETIAGTPWIAVYSFNFGDILVVSESLWMWIGFSMFGALLLLWTGIYLINRYMLVPLSIASQRIAASEALNRTIIATAPVGLCMLDRQTMQPLLANDLARSYIERWGQEPALARSILNAYDEIINPYGPDRQNNTALYTELPAPQHLDAPPLLAAFSSVRYQEREVLLCGLSDITIRKEAEAMLQQARQSADEANAAKSMFLATISHEIRTPLHGAMGNLELLENTPLSPAQHSTIGTINRSFFSLLQIINNVLDLSKAGIGQLHLSSNIFSPIKLLEDVALTFGPCIAKKNVQFFCLIDNQLPKKMYGDEARLRQIFNNLLSNAVKFTATGKIIMRADLSALHAGDCTFTVQIIDSGIGISSHEQKKLFMPFQQANNTISRTFGGTGLGLSLAKNLCDAMGGSIEINSNEHLGACFTVSLTLPFSNDSEKNSTKNQTKTLTDLVLVLCCDNQLWRRYLYRLLETNGATVITVGTDVPETVMHCHTFLVACQDNEIDSYAPLLKQYPHARHVLLTPLGPLPPERQAACIRVSAFSQDDLLLAVNPAVDVMFGSLGTQRSPSDGKSNEISRKGEHSNVDYTTLKISEPIAVISQPAALNILLVEDDFVNVSLAQQQLAMLGYDKIDLAHNGQEALEKCQKQTYQLILTDQFMPEMDGNHLAAALRQKAYSSKIIMLTASRPSSADRKNLDDVLLKPISLEQLRTILSRHFPSSPPPAASSISSILWDAFLQDYASTMDLLELASHNGDKIKCLQQLHKLKGALGILQQPLVKQVLALERRSKTMPVIKLSKAYRALREALDQLIATKT